MVEEKKEATEEVPKKSMYAMMCGCLGGKTPVETTAKDSEPSKEEKTEKEPVEEQPAEA